MLPILVVNPNTTKAMTDGLKPLLKGFVGSSALPPPTFFTAPEGVPSINNGEDCHQSADLVFPHLISPSPSSSSSSSSPSLLDSHSAVLIACYSVHPLVSLLKAHLSSRNIPPKPILGIFEASLLESLSLLAGSPPSDQFGIVTTGAVWEKLLCDGVADFLGAEGKSSKRFAGVATTGLSALELHDAPAEEVKTRLKDATKSLIRKSAQGGGRLRAVCLGCAGMAGMDETVREACIGQLGEQEGAAVAIVDGVEAGYALLEGQVRMG
ncbi:hypothetical protein JCM8547_008009 [Rhodosporidiobolus lusitaniae]